MKKHLFRTLLAALAVPGLHAAPVQLAGQSFEGTGLGFTTSVPQFDETTVATSDFFSVQPNNGTKLSAGTLAGGDGANMFAAEDIDTNPGPLVGPTQSITFNAVNIAGKTSTSVKLLLAAPGNGTTQAFYDHAATAADIDSIRVEASVDSGPFNPILQFSPTNPTPALNSTLSLDTDFDGLGGQGTALTAAFQEFNAPFPTGSSVQVRVVMHSNATSEYLCLDNVRIFADTPSTASPVLAGVPTTALAYTEGAPAMAVAPAITVTDVDSANLTSATVTISQNLVSSEDVLAATPSGAILAGDIVYTPATGTLTITRSATKAAYQTVLRSVTYRNSNTTVPSILPRQIRFSATDGTGTSNLPIREVTVSDAITLQTLPFVESFETDGRGSRYALDGRFTSSAVAYFDRQTTVPGVTNLDGTAAVVAEDTDINAAPEKAVRFLLNATGFIGSEAVLRLGAPGGSIYDTGDLIAVETSADGGAWTAVANFRSTAAGSGSMALDTNNDGTGDGTPLTAALQNFTFNLPAATALGLRVRFVSNVGGERLVVDRISVTGILPPVIVSNAGDTGPGSLRAAIATALAQPGASTITFDPLIFNGEAADVIALTSGELVIADTGGVTVDASGIAAGVTIRGTTSRLFRVTSGTTVAFQRLNLTGGNAVGGGAPLGYGGAIYTQGVVTMTDCSLSGATAFAGGAFFNLSPGNLTLVRCTVAGNSASHGGAIQNEATLVATNTTFANNTASQAGGAISAPFGVPVTLRHCTVSNNQTASGPGNGGGIIGNAVAIENTIVAGNTPENITGTPAATGNNLTSGIPRLAPLADNGGFTRTMHPLPGSPARDQITVLTQTTDQRGVPRPQWGAADIGAVEAGIQADCAWEVRDVFTSPVTVLGNLPNTDAMLANPAATNITGVVPFANFNDLNGTPGSSYFGGDLAFLCNNLTPQGLINTDDDSFATQARAFITITTAGAYTFGFSSDDGARLRLFATNGSANPVFTSSTSLTGGNPNVPAHSGNSLTFGAPTGDSATLGVCALSPGVYGVELTMWEDFGGASAEVFFASGAQTAIANCALLGGTRLTRTPGASRPVNDDFAAALPLSGAVVHTASCNAGATMQPSEPIAVPGFGNDRTKSIWWTWTAPATAGVQIDTNGSALDSVLAVLTGSSLGGLAEVAFGDDSNGLATSQVSFRAIAGTVYRIQVSGFAGGQGNILLNIAPASNFAPSFTAGANQSVLTNAGPQSVPGWATAINPGAAWETLQQVDFIVSTTNPGLFLIPPAVAPDGTLTYTPAPTGGSTATVSVQIHDDGGTANDGVDTSAAETFTITTALSPTTGTTLTINAGGSGSGTAAIAQNFNTVSAASVPWVDNSTVPGWYAQINDGTTASGIFQPSNGATALSGLVNCASAGTPADRAPGSKTTGTGNFANISYAVVIRNVGPLPVRLTRLRYAEELWRSGSVASMQEKVTAFYAISEAPLASIASGPSSATAVAGTGFTALPAAASTQVSSTTINTALDGNLPLNRSTVDFSPLAANMPALFPGQYITVKWTDTNETAGTDGHQAIDDVTLDFTEVPCAIFAVVSNVVRNLNSLNGSTDTVDFTLNVAGVGNGLSSGYTITAPAAFTGSGTYGTPLSFTARPLSDFTPLPVLSIRDTTDANCTTTATVTLPLVLGRNLLNNGYIQAQSPPAILRQTAAGFFPEVTMDPGTAVLTTDAAALTPGTEKCFNLHVDVIDSSTSSGFEADDTLKVELLCTTPAGLEIETMSYDADLNANGVMNGGATPLADEFNLQQKANAIKWTSTFHLVGTIPATATSVRLRISAAILGQTTQPYTEVFRFKLAELLSCPDSDADGISDAWEISHGTLGNDPASYFGLSSVTSDATNLNLAVRTNNQVSRTYQLLTSPDLQTWTRDGLPSAVSGLPSGPWPPLPFSRPITGPRRFYKVLVQQPQIENP